MANKIARIPVIVHEIAEERHHRRELALLIGWVATVVAVLIIKRK